MAKKKNGRPTKYKEEYIAGVDKYLEGCKDTTVKGKLKVNLPMVEGYATFIGVSKRVLYDWRDKYPKFLHALGKIEVEQKKRLLNMGLSNDYNSAIAKLILSANHEMKEKSETDITSGGEKIDGINYIVPKAKKDN